MKHKAKPSGSSGGSRLRLGILLATAAAFLLVPVAQAAAAFPGTFTVNIAGSGSGEVASSVPPSEESPEGFFAGTPPIECSYESPGPATGVCENTMTEAEGGEIAAIGVKAVPAPGSKFVEWTIEEGVPFSSACEEPEVEECFVGGFKGEEPENAKVTATFESEAGPELPLTLKINEGEGTVVSDPAGITCTGSSGKECSSEFEEGAEVTLTASPAAGYRFNFWGSCPSANGRQCTVTMSEAKEVKANFLKTWDLTVSKTAGSLPGLVAMAPPGDACLYSCQSVTYSYKAGASVTLTGNDFGPKHLVEFTGGSGATAPCNGTTECTVTIGEEDSSNEALFGFNAKAALSLEKAGGGTASIRATSGFKCRATCPSASAEYFQGPSEEVTVFWVLEPGTESLDWGTGAGTCTGVKTVNGSCTVTMDEAHELVATLE